MFDDIIFIASRTCDTPIALISLRDHDRQWFKARVGLDVRETEIAQSVCQIDIDEAGMLVIPDLTRDPRTAENPLVTGERALVRPADLIEGLFRPNARDGAGMVEVDLRLQKALALLARHAPAARGLLASEARDAAGRSHAALISEADRTSVDRIFRETFAKAEAGEGG